MPGQFFSSAIGNCGDSRRPAVSGAIMTTLSDPRSVWHSVNTLNTCFELLPQESYVLEATFPPHAGDLQSQIREMKHDETQFSRFYWILLGEDQRNAPGHASLKVAGQNSGGGVSTNTDNRGLARGSELVTPILTLWLPEYLKKRHKPSGYSAEDCVELMQPLRTAFVEVMKFGDMATDVAKVFASMDIEKVEYLLEHPEKLRSKLLSVAKDLKQESGLADLAHLPLHFEERPPQDFNEELPLKEPEDFEKHGDTMAFHYFTTTDCRRFSKNDGWPHDWPQTEI